MVTRADGAAGPGGPVDVPRARLLDVLHRPVDELRSAVTAGASLL